MNRREFLTGTAAAGILLATTGLTPGQTAQRKFRKGIWYADVPGETVLDRFKNAKAAGFDGVEPQGDLNDEDVLHARDETGVAVPSVACGPHARALSHPNPAKRAEGVQGVQRILRKAKRYGASSILAVPGSVNKETTYTQAWERTQSEFRKLAPLAEELGVKIAFENVWNDFLISPLEAARFVDELGSPVFGWQFDVGNMIRYGWPEHWIQILGKRIQKVHIKEFSRKKMNEQGMRAGFEVEFTEGDCDWPGVMKALDSIGYTGWAIAEPAWRPKGVDRQLRLEQISKKMDQILRM